MGKIKENGAVDIKPRMRSSDDSVTMPTIEQTTSTGSEEIDPKEACRGCPEYQCASLVEQNRPITELPQPETKGIFVIKDHGRIQYVGQSGDCMRERMLSHLSGYDAQQIGSVMKTFSKEYKMAHVTVGWVAIKSPRMEEHHYIKCLAKRQGQWPEFNKKRGRPPKRRLEP